MAPTRNHERIKRIPDRKPACPSLPVKASSRTIQNLCTKYLASRPHGGSTDERCLADWWIASWPQVQIENLPHDEILDLAQRLITQGRTESTLAHYLRFLRKACAWGAQRGILLHDPCMGLPLPKERTHPLRVLTKKEETRLCLALGEPYNEWVQFAILTGLRQSEQFQIRWADVDLEAGTVLLPHATAGTCLVFTLPAAAVSLLQRWCAVSRRGPWVFPDPANFRQPFDFHAFEYHWRLALRRAQIHELKWQDLRHTCGVRLAQQGVPVTGIQNFMRLHNKKHAFRYRAALRPAATPVRPIASHLSPFHAPKPAELRRALERDQAAQPVTFGELARLYATYRLDQRPSRKRFDQFFRQYWHTWAEPPAADISRRTVRAWFSDLQQTPSHANKALTLLRAAYNWGLEMDLLQCANPTTAIRRYPEQPRERFLNMDEVERFFQGLSFVSDKFRAFLLVLIQTGCRRGEAREMRWTDVEWQTRVWRKPRTKNGHSHAVKMTTYVIKALSRLPRTSPWVFPGAEETRPWSKSAIDLCWDEFRQRIGLDDVRLHDLRRSCASHLVQNGENLFVVQSVLGHRSLGPTSVYARMDTQTAGLALQKQADRFHALQERATGA